MTSTDLLPVIITIIGVGIALAGFMFTVMLVFFRMLNHRISDSETRLGQRIDAMGQRIDAMGQRIDAMGQRIDAMEIRMQRLEQETAEVKGMLNVIRDALPLRVGN